MHLPSNWNMDSVLALMCPFPPSLMLNDSFSCSKLTTVLGQLTLSSLFNFLKLTFSNFRA